MVGAPDLHEEILRKEARRHERVALRQGAKGGGVERHVLAAKRSASRFRENRLHRRRWKAKRERDRPAPAADEAVERLDPIQWTDFTLTFRADLPVHAC